MKIRDDLVFNKHTGELTGFVGCGDVDLNLVTIKKVDKLTSDILVFTVKSSVNPIS